MARRPLIEVSKIKAKYIPDKSTTDNPITFHDKFSAEGPLRGGNMSEVIGQRNSCDHFRCQCRSCSSKIITRRKPPKKGTRYFRCRNCSTWHFVSSGYFDQNRFETKPLKQEEFSEELYRVKLDYSPTEFEQHSFIYGSEKFVDERIDSEYYDIVEPKEKVS